MNAMHLVSALLIALALFSLQAAAQICAGCPEAADPNVPEIQKYAQEAVAEIQNQVDCDCTVQLDSIVNVTTQIVAGKLIHYDLIVKALTNTNVIRTKVQACSVDIWTKEWENFEQVTVNSCKTIAEEQQE